MERVLGRVPKNRCVDYLDDLLVHASRFDGALSNLREVFATIRQAGLQLNTAKCQLLTRKTDFLGHIDIGHGVATNPAKVSAVQGWPAPTNFNKLRWAWRPTTSALSKTLQRSPVNFTDGLIRAGHSSAMAFDQLKSAPVHAPVLAYLNIQQPFIVDTNTSNVGVGAVLSQEGGGGVAYFSHAL